MRLKAAETGILERSLPGRGKSRNQAGNVFFSDCCRTRN